MTQTADKSPEKIRVDKWLWHARFFKSRSLAAEMAGSGALRIDGVKVAKPSQTVVVGNVLTFAKAGHIRIIQVDAIGTRRGPATEAQALYTDLDPPQPKPPEEPDTQAVRDAGAGRPTKRERREIDALRQRGS